MLEGSQVFVWEFLKTGGLGVPKEMSSMYIYTPMYDCVDLLAIRLSEGHGEVPSKELFGAGCAKLPYHTLLIYQELVWMG